MYVCNVRCTRYENMTTLAAVEQQQDLRSLTELYLTQEEEEDEESDELEGGVLPADGEIPGISAKATTKVIKGRGTAKHGRRKVPK